VFRPKQLRPESQGLKVSTKRRIRKKNQYVRNAERLVWRNGNTEGGEADGCGKGGPGFPFDDMGMKTRRKVWPGVLQNPCRSPNLTPQKTSTRRTNKRFSIYRRAPCFCCPGGRGRSVALIKRNPKKPPDLIASPIDRGISPIPSTNGAFTL